MEHFSTYIHPDLQFSDSLSLRLRGYRHLTSLASVTRRFIMQKARRHNLRCSDRLWADGFRVSFTPLFGVLFTFPSRYWFAIGLPGVFSLTGWSPLIHARFLVPRATQDATRPSGGSRVRGCHPLRPAVPGRSGLSQLIASFVASGSQGIHRLPCLTFSPHLQVSLIGGIFVSLLV